jgi:predicted DNA-binding transcriptional regulator AlpA
MAEAALAARPKEHLAVDPAAQSSREEMLERLVQLLRHYDGYDRSDRSSFAELIRAAQLVLEIDDRELAHRLGVSRPTINRWASGDTAPHPIARPGVVSELEDWANEKLKFHRNYARRQRVAQANAA